MNKLLAEKFIKMAKIDQEIRFLAVKTSKKNKELTVANYAIYAIDLGHNGIIHRFIKKFGYPTKKLIGPEALKAFWLLIQHQDLDSWLQEECLKKCDFDKTEKEHLTDRVLVNMGKTQRFGTQNQKNKPKK
jgi:hypothetical protein